MPRKILLFPVLAVLLGACGQQPMYAWGGYEDDLYSYYQNPEKIEVLMAALNTTIVNAEESKRVPPGIYAEYGYLLMMRNKGKEAVGYFEKEKAAWPESAVLMDKMIALTTGGGKKTADAGGPDGKGAGQ